MVDDLLISPGLPAPLGYSKNEKGGNFSLFASHATEVILGLRKNGQIREIPLVQTGPIWHIGIAGDLKNYHYAFRIDGLSDPQKALFFDPHLWLQDPFSRFPVTESLPWGNSRNDPWSLISNPTPFDWENIKKPQIPYSDLIIYEMHVRGFTCHSSAQTKHPGTFLGLIEKIPYLKKLGVNAIELMPIFLFNEKQNNTSLANYWGYSPLSFFAPTGGFGSGFPVQEFKTLVKELHRNGIEILLDVVYNHTGEGKQKDPPFSFRGIDNPIYYMVDEKGHYRDYTGCNNTFNSNHPTVIECILSSLRYWANEMQVDGFRFDLAAIHTRGVDGNVLEHPPLLEKIAKDDLLNKTKLIAEGWDAVGLYLVDSFPRFGPWSVWNGKFRDTARNFIKGTDGFVESYADALTGSASLYNKYTPLRSINFITAHDGFTLHDLVSYNEKHNQANGEENRDGNPQNNSWNCGAEGPTQDPTILSLRERQERNFLLSLFLSQGVPMLFMGDEYGHTRQGNNNPYVQDNDLNWFLWDQLKGSQDRFEFVSSLIAFRKNNPSFRKSHFLSPAEISWHNAEGAPPQWTAHDRFIAFTLKGSPSHYVAFNAYFTPLPLTLLHGPWIEVVNTSRPWKEHNLHLTNKTPLPPTIELPPYSALLLRHL